MKILLLFGSIVIFCIFFELFLSSTDLDIKSLKSTLFFDCADTEIQRISDNPRKLYELIPNLSFVYNYIHPKEDKYDKKERTVKINNLGFRDVEREKDKPDEVFRIIVLGGSNTYGALVNNEDTYPSVMQRLLDLKYPGKYEVWNAGLHGYVMSQEVTYAEEIIEKYNPDLMIFQLHNWGRRAFSCQKEFEIFFKKIRNYLKKIPHFYFQIIQIY